MTSLKLLEANNVKTRAKGNIHRYTKDYLHLYVCPTGASDAQDDQIKASKCINARLWLNAISMVPYDYPPRNKEVKMLNELGYLTWSKAKQEVIAQNLSKQTSNPVIKQIANTLVKSNRLINEDIARKSRFMLPQSLYTRNFLNKLLKNAKNDVRKI